MFWRSDRDMARKQNKSKTNPPMAKKLTSPRPSITKKDNQDNNKKDNHQDKYAGAISAPPPSSLPKPPARWVEQKTDMAPPPIVLQRSEFVQKQLQGNLLHSLLAPRYPLLAGKITGMLLELDAEERDELLRSPT